MNNLELNESQKRRVRDYIRAKDDNKPHLMASVFAEYAFLEMKVNTDNITFPSDTVGLEAITDVLVRNFSQTYENVYTFCLTDSVDSQENSMSCKWLVTMTERGNGSVRVGFGRYDWVFDIDSDNLIKQLVITIEQMLTLAPEHSEEVFGWVEKIPYPFCDSEQMFEFLPNIDVLKLLGNGAIK